MRTTGLLVSLSASIAICGCNALVGIEEPIERTESADASVGGSGGEGGAGAAGSAGSAGKAGGGTGGVAGAAGTAGAGGAAGAAGSAGTAGAGGSAGTAGTGGCSEQPWYQDSDKDAYGNPNVSISSCNAPAGYVSDKTDCDDALSSAHPGAVEECNAVDENCDGKKDETFACVKGQDGACTTTCGTQGHGVCSSTCTAPTGAACFPPSETCNGIDDDCDGMGDKNLVTAGPRYQQASSTVEIISPRVVANSDGTYTLLFLRNNGGNVFDVRAQKIDSTGKKSGAEVGLVSGSSYGNTVHGIDAILVADVLYVAWISGTHQAWLAGFTPTTYATKKTAKSYAQTVNGSAANTRYLRLTAPGLTGNPLLHLTMLGQSTGANAIERVEIAPPAISTLPSGARHIHTFGGLGLAAFGAGAGDNTVVAYLDDPNTLALLFDNGGTADASFRYSIATLSGSSDRIRWPSVAVTPDGGIGLIWAEYPFGSTPTLKFAYMSSFNATPVVKAVDTQAPYYYYSTTTEYYLRSTDLRYLPGPNYFLVGYASAPSNGYLNDFPRLAAIWPVGSPNHQQAVALGDFSQVLNSDEVSLAATSKTGIFAYDLLGSDQISSQLVGCY